MACCPRSKPGHGVKLFRTPIPCRSHILFAVIVAVVLVCLHNWRFWQQTFESVRPASAGDAWFIVSLFLLLVFIHTCAVLLFPGRRALPMIAALLFIVAALAGYFRDTFGVIIDKDMIRNVVRTDVREASDFLSLRLVLYMVGLGLIPALVAARVRLPAFGIGRQFIQRGRFFALGLVVVVLAALPVISHYASFLREHRAIRNLLVPAEPIYAAFD